MIIKFDWYDGQMTVDAEIMILDMPMSAFRKWVKLFIRYGRPEDHEAFLQLLEEQIRENERALTNETDKKEVTRLQKMLKRRMSMKGLMA